MNAPNDFRWSPLPSAWRARAFAEPHSLLLESSLPSATEHRSLLFTGAARVLHARHADDLPSLFRDIEDAVAKGKWVAGYMAYEAGMHFLEVPPGATNGPLGIFGVYDPPAIFDHHVQAAGEIKGTQKLNVALMPTLSRDAYEGIIDQIKEWIAAGETYQVNFTMRLQSPCADTAADVYTALCAQQASSYAAICTLDDDRTVLSFSPELFFRVTSDGAITTRPMKGTAPRGTTHAEDDVLAEALRNDEKNRAEHVMIVDLLRNDLNRICQTGTVRADDLFHVERYSTLHQMTSRVSGALKPGIKRYEVFRALFPGGSITGAPKRHTAQLIRQVERDPRGVYTGTIGYFAPDGSAAFNIAIRTAVATPGTLTFGVGGGIVADSTAASEYNEALLKAAFIQRAAHPFRLVETMRAVNGSMPFLEDHLRRLTTSAAALGFACDERHIRKQLALVQTSGRVRLQLHRDGRIDITTTEAQTWPAEIHLRLSRQQTDATSPHLRHKTTFRPEYDTLGPSGFDGMLFQNTGGEFTESAIANLLAQIDGRWYTPPLSSGVLHGVMRSHLLQTGQIEEHILTLHDLRRSTALALCNAVRGIGRIASLQLADGERILWKASSTLPTVGAW